MTECPIRVFREGWLANWLITERVTGLGGSCIQLTQSDMSAYGLIVVKEMTHTHTQPDHCTPISTEDYPCGYKAMLGMQ